MTPTNAQTKPRVVAPASEPALQDGAHKLAPGPPLILVDARSPAGWPRRRALSVELRRGR